MRKLFILTCILAVSYPFAGAHAFTGVSIGGKVGFANYSGDVLPASGDVGGAVMYGAVMEIATLPVFDLELHANYFSNELNYTYDVGGSPVTSAFDFRDLHVLALVKKNLIGIPASPISLYLGGGMGWHLLNTELAKNAAGDPSQADTSFEMFSNSARISGQGLASAKVSLPVIPLAIFGEARYGVIFADENLRTMQVEGGLMMKF